MKKLKILSLLLCLSALVAMLSACGNGGGTKTEDTAGDSRDSEKTTNATTPSNTEAPTEEATDAPTEATTEAPTEEATEAPTETEPAPTLNAEEVARMEAMLAADFAGPELPIGGWSTPAAALRDGYSGIEGSYDRAFQLLADAGLNYMITLEEWSSGYWPLESLSSAKKAGLKLWYNCVGQSADYSMEKINAMLADEAADALVTIYTKDEPTFDDIGETAATMAAIRAALGDTRIPVMANLLPTYATPSMVTSDYRNYVRTYLEAAKPDRLMFDYYPYQGASGDSLNAMMVNIAIALEEAERAGGIELYTFLQSSGQAVMREPNVAELRANAHVNLCMGVKGFAYFLVCEHYEGWGYTNMLTAKGETTELYDKVKTVNAELEAFKGVFLDYNFKGLLQVNNKTLPTMMDRAGCSTILESFGNIASFETTRQLKSLIGCFEDGDGRPAYYVVNPNYDKAATVKLTLNEARAYVLWTKDGAEKIEPTQDLTIKLDKGDAAFLVEFDVYE